MNNLARFENDGIEIFIDPLGNSFASLNGVARMAMKAPKTIFQFKVLRNFVLQEVQIDTPGGKQGVTLFDEDQIIEVLEKYNTKRLKQFAKLGIQTALHQIAGYQQQQHDRPDLNTFNIYDLPVEQVDRLLLSAEMHEEQGLPIDPIFLAGIDSKFWDMSYEVAEHLSFLLEYQSKKQQCEFYARNQESIDNSDFPIGLVAANIEHLAVTKMIIEDSESIQVVRKYERRIAKGLSASDVARLKESRINALKCAKASQQYYDSQDK